MRVPVTVVIPTLNEADRLPACLASVAWADEVIVADAGSRDGTPAIARRLGALVLHTAEQTIGGQKNAAIAMARNAWILSIDADERVTPALRDAVARAVASPTAAAYRVRLRNRYLGAPYERGHWGRDWHVRLYPQACRWSSHRVHERLECEGPVASLDGALEHEPYRDLAHQLDKAQRYAAWGARDLRARGQAVGLSHLVMRPLWRFLRTWLLEGMWREGRRGFVFCVVHAWCAFAKYALAADLERLAQSAPVARARPERPPRVFTPVEVEVDLERKTVTPPSQAVPLASTTAVHAVQAPGAHPRTDDAPPSAVAVARPRRLSTVS